MTKQEFEKLSERARTSGSTLKDFLKREGIAYSTYNYWRKKIETEECFCKITAVSESCQCVTVETDTYVDMTA